MNFLESQRKVISVDVGAMSMREAEEYLETGGFNIKHPLWKNSEKFSIRKLGGFADYIRVQK